MKRLLALSIAIIALFGLTGCGSKSSSNANKESSSTKSEVSKSNSESGTVIDGINWGKVDNNTKAELNVALKFITNDDGINGPMSGTHLIEQLSGDGGQGWTKAEATRVVNIITPKVDWDKIAVYAARNERESYGVTGNAIIPQLTSKVSFDPQTGNNYSNYGFTEDQAKYAVEHIDDSKYPKVSSQEYIAP